MLSFIEFTLNEVVYQAPKPVKTATQMYTTTHRSMRATIRGNHGAARTPEASYSKQKNQSTTLKTLTKQNNFRINKNSVAPARLQMRGKPVQTKNIGTVKPLSVEPNQTS